MSEPKSLLIPSLLVVGGIAVGVGLTLYLNHPTAPAAPATSSATGGSTPAATGLDARLAGTENSPEVRAAMSILSEAIQTVDRDKRAEMLRKLAADLVEKDVKLALEAGAKIPDANDKMEFMRALFAAWGAKDPKAAADYAKANFTPGLMLGETIDAVVEKWAAQDPRTAREWVEANTSGPLKDEALGMLLQGWTRVDPVAASAWFLSTGSTSQTLLNAIVSTWTDLDPKAAAAWVEGLTNNENRNVGRVMLASEWASQDPQAAAAYFGPMLTDKSGLDLGTALINRWGASDPNAAAAWVDQLPHGPVRNEAAGTLATIWAAADIKAATAWSDKLEDPEMKAGVIDHLGTTWGAIEPTKAIEWIHTLPEGESRVEATKGAFNSWAATDQPGLAAYIAKTPPGPESDLARRGLAAVQSDQNHSDALQTALGINDPSLRSDEVAKYFRHWRKLDDAAAQQWLRGEWNSFAPDIQARLTKEQQRRIVPK